MATMRRHIAVDSPLLEPVMLLRPADWAGDAEEGSWPGRAPSPAELGIREPPVAS
jgi:hypothetical protein